MLARHQKMSTRNKPCEKEVYALSRLRDSPLRVNKEPSMKEIEETFIKVNSGNIPDATSKSESNSRSSEGTQTDRERQHESGNSSKKS